MGRTAIMKKNIIFIIFNIILTFSECSEKAEPDLSKVNFYLWTRETQGSFHKFDMTLESLHESPFNPAHKVVILVHGWNSDGEGFGSEYAPAFLEAGEYNVISVDWGALETWANSPQVAARSQVVGEYASELIPLLISFGDHVLNNIHLVGHSLGA